MLSSFYFAPSALCLVPMMKSAQKTCFPKAGIFQIKFSTKLFLGEIMLPVLTDGANDGQINEGVDIDLLLKIISQVSLGKDNTWNV